MLSSFRSCSATASTSRYRSKHSRSYGSPGPKLRTVSLHQIDLGNLCHVMNAVDAFLGSVESMWDGLSTVTPNDKGSLRTPDPAPRHEPDTSLVALSVVVAREHFIRCRGQLVISDLRVVEIP